MIIDSEGEYLTRAGNKVLIEEVDYQIRYDIVAFKCGGWMFKPDDSDKKEWKIWHYSGKSTACSKENDWDIVAKIAEQ